MIKRLTLTEDHLKLINLVRFERDKKKKELKINLINPYILSGNLVDIAIALGKKDMAIAGTENAPEGAAFPDDVEEYLLSVHHYVVDNLYDIEVLIHQMCWNGGIKAGTYVCLDNEEIWSKEDK